MSNTSELERQNAELRRQLDATKAAQTSGWAGLFSLVGSVVAIVPRWLIIAAGVVAVGFFGAEAYFKISMLAADNAIKQQTMEVMTQPVKKITRHGILNLDNTESASDLSKQ